MKTSDGRAKRFQLARSLPTQRRIALKLASAAALAAVLVLAALPGCSSSAPSPTIAPSPTTPAKPTAAAAPSPTVAPTAVPTPPATVAAAPSPTATPSYTVYVVQPGDTLNKIAEKFGVPLDAIIKANNLSNPDNLDIGQEIKIPKP